MTITSAAAPAQPAAPRLLRLGDAAWTLEFGNAIEPALRERVLGLCAALDAAHAAGRLAGVIEWVPTFRSVTVHLEPLRCDAEALGRELLELASQSQARTASGGRWLLPVCFDAEFAPDLDDVAAAKGMRPQDVVDALTQAIYSVYMLGFLPGFAYMGGLPAQLEMPRLAVPRTSIAARSLAIAGRMCALYPWNSPGGWRLLGRTPVRLFDATREDRPALLAPGDEVRWQPIGRARFDALDRAWAAGAGDPASLRAPSESSGERP